MRSICCVLLVLAPLAACHDDHGHGDPDVEACEHLASGPYAAITGTPGAAGAPAVAVDHRAYTVTLPAGASGNLGTVAYAAPEAIDYLIYVDQAITVDVSDGREPIAPEATSTGSAACATIKGRTQVALPVGTAYLRLASPTVTQVNLVIEPGEHDH